MKPHRKMSPTLKRFLIFYFVFALVFICAYIPVYSYMHGTIYENVRAQAQQRLDGGMSALDSSASVLLNLYTATRKDSRFRTLKTVRGNLGAPSDIAALVDAFRYPILSAPLITDAGVVCSETLAITKQRSFYSSAFYSFYPGFTQCRGLSFEEWFGQLAGRGVGGGWLPEGMYYSRESDSFYPALCYGRVWYAAASVTPIVFYGLVDADALIGQMAAKEVLSNGYLKILGGNGEVLALRGNAQADGTEVIRAVSGLTQLSVEVGLPKAYLLAQLVPLERMIIIYLIGLLAIAVVLVVVFSHRSARPMQRLLRSIDQASLPESDTTDTLPAEKKRIFAKLERDYDTVASSFSQMDSLLKSSAQVIQEQKEKLCDQLFDKALLRSLYSAQERQDFAYFFPGFPHPFQLALLKCDQAQGSVEEAAQMRTLMLRQAQALLPALYYAHALPSGGVILVLAHCQLEEMQTLQKRLTEESDVAVHVLLSQPFSAESELSAAFEQVQYLDLLPADSDVVAFQQLSSMETGHASLPLSFSALQEMYEALSTGNDALARIILNDCADQLMTHADRVMLARHTYSMIGHMLAHMKLEYSAALFAVVIPGFDGRNLERLFRQELPECFRMVCVSLLENQAPQSDLDTAVLRFINENLFSPDMCVTFVADRFSIAKATLQKIIKAATGATFSAYISAQRLERAYQLLQEPGVSVQKVSELCGFSSPNSFYKAFRRRYGAAPSAVTEEAEDS